jgi:hypothetical protein
MSTPAKQSSRWGSFLQQAVAGVESRLDNILTDAEEGGKVGKPPTTTPEGSGKEQRTSSRRQLMTRHRYCSQLFKQ